METTKLKKTVRFTRATGVALCFVLVPLMVLLAAGSCGKPETPTTNGDDGKDTIEKNGSEIPLGLQNTKWKLVGIFDAETDTLIKELEPKDCEDCYTLTFDTSTPVLGISIWAVTFMYSLDPILFGCDLIGEPFNGSLYTDALASSHSYTFNENELKFYFNDIKKREPISRFLLYKPFKVIEP